MRRAIREIQDFGVEPDVWKIEGLDRRDDCVATVEVVRRQGRDRVGTIILGRGENERKVVDWLSVAATVDGFIGFAVGRSTFLQTIVDLRADKTTAEAGAKEIGRRFQHWIDVFQQAQARAAARPRVAPTATRGAHGPPVVRRILVVDDTRDSVFILGKLLETFGQQVTTSDDAEAAVELALSVRPDVVISDIGMPGVDGYELARRLRAEPTLQGMVLVALSGYGQDIDRQRALDAGFDHYLEKPISLDALKNLLANLPAARPTIAR